MKIVELRFKNLNSLQGEWLIDFANPEYTENGIFALTGPTGAGKTTVLDAICLALYGMTPRLGKITKNSNEIMSRQTGECYAEVVFESQEGVYRCHWEQRRARKSPDGKLQDPEHQIAEEATGKLIESKKSLVAGVIEEKIGMNFGRFSRSILLAQGSFDSFLRAKIEEKSEILEQITGTEIYSDISRRVHENMREEKEKLKLLEAETAGIVLLSEEEVNTLTQQVFEYEAQEVLLEQERQLIEQTILWLQGIAQIESEIKDAQTEFALLQEQHKAFLPKKQQLDNAKKAANFNGVFATLSAKRQHHQDIQAELATEEKALPDMITKEVEQQQALDHAKIKKNAVHEQHQKMAPILILVRNLEQKLALQRENIARESAANKLCQQQINQEMAAKEAQELLQQDLTNQLALSSEYLQDNQHDDYLLENLVSIKEQFNRYWVVQGNQKQKKEAWEQAQQKRHKSTEKQIQHQAVLNKQQQTLMGIGNQLNAEKSALQTLLQGKLLREYRTEQDTLLREMVFLTQIHELEEMRNHLKENKACPLCGSLKHPFLQGTLPPINATEQRIAQLDVLLATAAKHEDKILAWQSKQDAVTLLLNQAEKEAAAIAQELGLDEQQESTCKNNVEELKRELEALRAQLLVQLQPLGIVEFPHDDVNFVDGLSKRLKKWQEHQDILGQVGQKEANVQSEIKRMNAVLFTLNKELMGKEALLEVLRSQEKKWQEERFAALADKDVDQEESNMQAALVQAEHELQLQNTLYVKLQEQLQNTLKNIRRLQNAVLQAATQQEQAKTEFLTAIAKVGFADEGAFLAARLLVFEQEALQDEMTALEHLGIQLQEKIRDRKSRLAQELVKNHGSEPLSVLQDKREAQEQALKNTRERLAGCKHALVDNIAAKNRIEAKYGLIQTQKEACLRIERLHVLIGSADGKKFRNFAQGLTFELMVAHTNRQLEKMTDRYLLVRDSFEPLELNVIDNYQAGEVRSTKNLSGGESFIISLSLALGLSKMASRKVRVDSLFLDEGFGTLDENALDTALDTLSNLHSEGKLIGIISHVGALKERIATQIVVTPQANGMSKMTGAGCRKVLESHQADSLHH